MLTVKCFILFIISTSLVWGHILKEKLIQPRRKHTQILSYGCDDLIGITEIKSSGESLQIDL